MFNPSDNPTLSQGPEWLSVDVAGPSNLEYVPSTFDKKCEFPHAKRA